MKVDRNDVVAARARISGAVLETPLIEASLHGHRVHYYFVPADFLALAACPVGFSSAA